MTVLSMLPVGFRLVFFAICIVVALISYLIGSIPTGYLLAKARGVDIHSVGSGSTGATNVARGVGKLAGLVVLAVDVLKGPIAILASLAFLYVFNWIESGQPERFFDMGELLWFGTLSGFFAVLGHDFPVWLKFHGGKGVATSLGVMLVLAPFSTFCALAVWILVFGVCRYVSVASMSAAVSLPFLVLVLFRYEPLIHWPEDWIRIVFAAALTLALLLIWRHKDNLKRLRAGTEPKFSSKKREAIPKS